MTHEARLSLRPMVCWCYLVSSLWGHHRVSQRGVGGQWAEDWWRGWLKKKRRFCFESFKQAKGSVMPHKSMFYTLLYYYERVKNKVRDTSSEALGMLPMFPGNERRLFGSHFMIASCRRPLRFIVEWDVGIVILGKLQLRSQYRYDSQNPSAPLERKF